jgi:hypothetical protein
MGRREWGTGGLGDWEKIAFEIFIHYSLKPKTCLVRYPVGKPDERASAKASSLT